MSAENLETEKAEDFVEDTANISIDTNEMKTILPLEMIINIFTYLDDINDIRNCMELSKEIRDIIFKTPEIVRKMKLNISKESDFEFVVAKGEFFRSLSLEVTETTAKLTRLILHQVPNLEELVYEGDFDNWNQPENEEFYEQLAKCQELEISKELPKLPKLRNLIINVWDLSDFLEHLKNVKNLEKMFCKLHSFDDEETFLPFLFQQNKLKHLFLMPPDSALGNTFPSRDISMDINFQLKNLKFSGNCDENFLKFYQTQVEDLEELEMENFSVEILDILFEESKKLRKINHFGRFFSPLFSDLYPYWSLDTVKYFESSRIPLHLNDVYIRFPNLESLRCNEIFDNPGSFDKLVNLEVDEAYVDKLQDMSFPNLKYLAMEGPENITNDNWINFVKNVQNIENLKIGSIRQEDEQQIVFKFINNFTNLKTFEIWYEDNDIEECKFSVDFDKRIIKSVKALFDLEIVRENFEGFEFVECTVPQIRVRFLSNS